MIFSLRYRIFLFGFSITLRLNGWMKSRSTAAVSLIPRFERRSWINMQKVLILLLVVLTFDFSSQFHNGAPLSRCETLTPSHGGSVSQEFPSPFEIVPSVNRIKNGDVMKVEIRSVTPGQTFNGFILQARTMTDPYVIQGEFHKPKSDETLYMLLNCSESHTTVTQANNTRLESLVFEWTAPKEFIGVIRFQ